MSSSKQRLKVRIKRLSEMYTALGRDPNAKGNPTDPFFYFILTKRSNFIDIEIKSLIVDFDKVVRKQSARLKKGKHQRLQTRQQILMTYGLRSRERISNQYIKKHSFLLKDSFYSY
jgi:hypothetical protein